MVLKVASPSWIGGEEEEGKQAFAHFLLFTALDYSSFYLFLSHHFPRKHLVKCQLYVRCHHCGLGRIVMNLV